MPSSNTKRSTTLVVCGPELAAYGFGEGHPFGADRHDVFLKELEVSTAVSGVGFAAPRSASIEELSSFHEPEYVDFVRQRSAEGSGFLDNGDTPVVPGIFEAAQTVAGATLSAVEAVMKGDYRHAFIPIAGLHHAARDRAAGFCVFNDCGIAVEQLRARYGVRRVAYVDIDAHHGDGVFYGFEEDPDLLFADIHEDGRYLYPGTGHRHETGRGEARDTKLNLPLAPGAGDDEFGVVWKEVEAYLEAAEPEFILFQCGADSLAGDPITHLQFSEEAHAFAAARLREIATRYCDGRLVAMGGGGYNRRNIARAWTRVVEALAL